MKKVKMMKKYAELIASIGVGANSNQDIVIEASVEMVEFVRYLTQALYASKVKNIDVVYDDKILTKQKILHTPSKKLTKVSEWRLQRMKEMTENGSARIVLVGDDPCVFSSISSDKVGTYMKAQREATYPYRRAYNSNELAWCIAAVPTKKWARRVFPDVTPTQAVIKLWEAIYKACRVDLDSDPVAAWKKHISQLRRNADYLNKLELEKMHYTNGLGTDLWITLPKNYRFCGAHSIQSRYNTQFTPNIPTEEIFSSPKLDGVNGKVFSSKPLSYNGCIIDKFWLEFKDGRVVDFDAEVGREFLKNLVEFDEGSCRLGECALVPYHSPISEMGILYFETLFDENASCHLALGDSFDECVLNGELMLEEEKRAIGLNSSKEHVDFMIGTADLSIVGYDYFGKETQIFADGDFAF